jgi:hypothetical protein
MPHLSELHGAATHLAVVAIPVYVIVLLSRRAGLGGAALARAELGQFRRVHGDALFPPAVVGDRQFAAVDAWLRTLPRRPGRRD